MCGVLHHIRGTETPGFSHGQTGEEAPLAFRFYLPVLE
jgi:hypothetical protein